MGGGGVFEAFNLVLYYVIPRHIFWLKFKQGNVTTFLKRTRLEKKGLTTKSKWNGGQAKKFRHCGRQGLPYSIGALNYSVPPGIELMSEALPPKSYLDS
jgi:hypothetical protein